MIPIRWGGGEVKSQIMSKFTLDSSNNIWQSVFDSSESCEKLIWDSFGTPNSTNCFIDKDNR